MGLRTHQMHIKLAIKKERKKERKERRLEGEIMVHSLTCDNER